MKMLARVKEIFTISWCFTALLMNYGAVWADNRTNWSEINEMCGISLENRIVGGTKAELGQFPWIAHLGIMRRENDAFTLSYECGGALIHPLYVLTAAHCAMGLEDGEALVAVKLGEHNLETEIDCEADQCADPPQVIYPTSITVPTEYNGLQLRHDVALIRLSEPANMTRYVSPVCLPSGDLATKNLLGDIVEVAGWGWFNIDFQKASPTLQVVKLPVVELDKCKKIKQLEAYDFSLGQLCVGGVAGKDSCNGDSGGPLVKVMATHEHGPRYFLFGLVSVGVPSCGKFNLPAVYTNVSHYLPWILDNIDN